MARRISWRGIYPPIATPFTRDGALDEPAFRKVLEQTVADGCDGVVVAGCTGEWYSMTDAERVRVFEIAVDQIKRRIPVIAGTSAMGTKIALEMQEAAKKLGCDGTMVLPPPFLLPNRAEVVHFFGRLAKVGLPIMLYNNPPRGSMNLTHDLIADLLQFDEVVAIKDSAVDLPQLIDTLIRHGNEITVFAGREPYLLANHARGVAGSIAMITNIMGHHVCDYWGHLEKGRYAEAVKAQKLIDGVYSVIQGMSVKLSRPTGHWTVLKACMNVLGRHGGYMREPFLPVADQDIPKLAKALADIGLTPESMAGHRKAAE